MVTSEPKESDLKNSFLEAIESGKALAYDALSYFLSNMGEVESLKNFKPVKEEKEKLEEILNSKAFAPEEGWKRVVKDKDGVESIFNIGRIFFGDDFGGNIAGYLKKKAGELILHGESTYFAESLSKTADNILINKTHGT